MGWILLLHLQRSSISAALNDNNAQTKHIPNGGVVCAINSAGVTTKNPPFARIKASPCQPVSENIYEKKYKINKASPSCNTPFWDGSRCITCLAEKRTSTSPSRAHYKRVCKLNYKKLWRLHFEFEFVFAFIKRDTVNTQPVTGGHWVPVRFVICIEQRSLRSVIGDWWSLIEQAINHFVALTDKLKSIRRHVLTPLMIEDWLNAGLIYGMWQS